MDPIRGCTLYGNHLHLRHRSCGVRHRHPLVLLWAGGDPYPDPGGRHWIYDLDDSDLLLRASQGKPASAADAAAKTSLVDLIELRVARGMCGKSYMLITGDVAAVSAAIERAQQEVSTDGMLLDSSVIPNPDKRLWDTIL